MTVAFSNMKIFLCALLSMFVGATILGTMISGVVGVFSGPVFMIFGWFYFPVILILHFFARIAWQALDTRKIKRTYFILAGGVVGPLLFSLIGIKEEGQEALYLGAYILASCVTGVMSATILSSPTFPSLQEPGKSN
jgi:hypothetical protein